MHAPNGKIRVVIIEDYRPLLEQLRVEVDSFIGLKCVGIFESCEDALQKFGKLLPDVVLMDLGFPRMDGIECTRRMKAKWPRTKIVILSADRSKVEAAFIAGCNGYIDKGVMKNDLARYIERAAKNEQFTSEGPFCELTASWRNTNIASILSPREAQIIRLKYLEGLRVKEIADKLGISENTTASHKRSAEGKLKLRSNRAEIIKRLRAS